MLTLVFLSFHSDHHIKRLVNYIHSSYPIIIIENSGNKKLKVELERKHNNVHVEICEENLGFSKGMNLGIKLSKTPYVFLNPADIEISNESLNLLNETVKNFTDFGMICPVYKDESVHSNYAIWTKKNKPQNINLFGKTYRLKEVDFIDGTIILNKKITGDIFFDENMFIYFETMDLCKRLIEKNIKLYAMDQITFEHFGGQSHNKIYNHEAHLSRNWHYNWSKFYFINKHNNYFYALRKISPNLIKAVKNYIRTFLSDKKKGELHVAEIKGIMTSIFKRKSYYRPYK